MHASMLGREHAGESFHMDRMQAFALCAVCLQSHSWNSLILFLSFCILWITNFHLGNLEGSMLLSLATFLERRLAMALSWETLSGI